MVEHLLAKEKVASSSLVSRSKLQTSVLFAALTFVFNKSPPYNNCYSLLQLREPFMKFVLGVLVGVGTGVAATLLLSNRSDDESLVASLQHNAQRALSAAKAASSQRERELWREYHERVPNPDQPVLG